MQSDISHRAKWTAKQVQKIRRLYNEGWSQQKLARHFGGSQSAISMLLRGITYRRVGNQHPRKQKAA